MNFWDSSAILPLVLDEPASDVVRRILARDASVAVWWSTPVECMAGLARVLRARRIDESEFDGLAVRLGSFMSKADEIGPSQLVRETAKRILGMHPLRAADALQLAAAIVWAGQPSAKHGFVCLDRRRREAAVIEGFRVLPEVLDQSAIEEQQ